MFSEILFFTLAGIFVLCACGFNWDWFFLHPKARLVVRILTRTGARFFYAFLGLVLLLIGTRNLISGGTFLPKSPTLVIVELAYPGADSQRVVDTIARAVEPHIAHEPYIDRFTTESRSDGSFRLLAWMKPLAKPESLRIYILNCTILASPTLPAGMDERDFNVRLASPAVIPHDQLSLAVVSNSETDDPSALYSVTDAIQTLLHSAGALINPESLLDQRPAHDGSPPRLIFRYNQRTAILLRGSAPDGQTVANATSRCVQLVDKERAKRSEWARIQLVDLTR